ncbi:hypothetical protein KY329_04680 [Candidatus Woesearchaeota archaeon]|nr:hypothetical protein [Candidatus Woesearchaeota archaeon]
MAKALYIETINAIKKNYPNVDLRYEGKPDKFILTVMHNKDELELTVFESDEVIQINAKDEGVEGTMVQKSEKNQAYLGEVVRLVGEWLAEKGDMHKKSA